MEEIQDHTISAEMEVFPILGESLRRQEDDQVLLELEQIKYVPFVLSFSNLTYRISRRRKLTLPACFHRNAEGTQVTHDGLISNSKIILNGISGEAREGEIMAVLGASGSGKSTLIDALASRITKESLKGSVTLNGEVLESRVSKVISAYVMQDDLLFPMLTVEETLMFSAEFRLPNSVSKTKKKARVDALIDQLGLQNVAKTVIGDEGYRGVSGGERRRVSIGVDIIHDPILLFLDEPTSGLDSTSAFMVVKVLQRIARTGSIVIMSIHQPSYRILGLLHSLIFLSQGQTIYNGSPNDLPIFISEFGYSIPENENWAEFMLDLIHELEEGSPDGTKALLEFNKSWQQKNFKNKHPHSNSNSNGFGISLNDAIGTSICKGKLVSDLTSSTRFSAFANPFYTEIIVLAKRSITNSRRRPRVMATRLGMILVTGFILATFFWHLNDSPKGVEERLGFFAFAISTTFYNCVQDLPSFVEERFILIRETAYNTYRRSSYVISNSIVAIPALIFLSIVFSVITFWAVSLAGGLSGFLYYFLTILASFWAGSSFVTFISGLVPNVLLGYVILVATLSYYLLFSGFFINKDRIPSYWIWFHFISLVKYPYEGVLKNEFDNPNMCFVRGVQMFDNTPISVVSIDTKVKLLKVLSDSTGLDISPTTCVTTGVDILRNQGINELSKWNCIWVTLAWGFLFRILFYFVLLFGSKNKRR